MSERDLFIVQDWLNARGYTGESAICHDAALDIARQKAALERKDAALRKSEQALKCMTALDSIARNLRDEALAAIDAALEGE